MPRRLIQRYLPDPKRLRGHRHLRCFGTLLHDHDLWHLSRRSVAGATGLGVFIAFLPMPFQMLLAAGTAIWLRVNLPIAVTVVWITNPLTMPAIFFSTYKLGACILDLPARPFRIELSIEWLAHEAGAVLPPLLAGSILAGAVLGLSTYVAIRLAWRFHVLGRRRRNERLP